MSTAIEPRSDRGLEAEGSDRNFAYVFAAVFAVAALLPVLHRNSPHWWAMGVAGAFLGVGTLWPEFFGPFKRIWLAFGRLLHRVVSPLIMSIIFFLCVTPTGIIMRRRGKDFFSLKQRPELKSYWIDKDGAPTNPQSMKKQY